MGKLSTNQLDKDGNVFLPTKVSRATARDEWFAALLMVAAVLVSVAVVLQLTPNGVLTGYFISFGVIGLWRYSWWFTHFIRALVYLHRRFPVLRRQADEIGAHLRADEVFALVTSYDINQHHSFAVYDALIKNAVEYGAPTTIVAAITRDDDRAVIREVMRANGFPSNVEIVMQFQKGDGKRSAMGMALRTIARRAPSSNSLVIFLDGDVQLTSGALARTAGFFFADKNLVAATTNNGAHVSGGSWTKEWYWLRYAQRHLVMSSLSLSKKLLVLTGRYSVFRATQVVTPSFIKAIENDSVHHWRHGEIKMMSGDDKSSWYELLKQDADMLYIPDVFALGYEQLPQSQRFFVSTWLLMRRWFGNMLRTSDRAIALGPNKLGFFFWWVLLDQRVSMWTTLIGPIVAILLCCFVSPIFALLYFLWVLFLRSFMSIVVGRLYGRFSILWPALLYYSQVVGAFIKVFVLFRLNRQSWTRQNIASRKGASRMEAYANWTMHIASLAILVLVISIGLFSWASDAGGAVSRLALMVLER